MGGRTATGDQVREAVALWSSGATDEQGDGFPIPDGVARGIAYGWQAPGGYGLVFHRAVSGQWVEADELREAVAHERAEAQRQGPEVVAELDALSEWIDRAEETVRDEDEGRYGGVVYASA